MSQTQIKLHKIVNMGRRALKVVRNDKILMKISAPRQKLKA